MTTPRRGIHPQLERAANEILRVSMAGVTKHSEKSDVLTPWKEQDRLRREVYVESGTPDPAVRRGNFHRVTNPERPELNSREGHSRARPAGMERLRAFVDGHQEED
jgi:hypothetical protein